MADTLHRLGQEQQLVYRIDCDKHSAIGGAPLVLLLQKESAKPIIVILFGTQTYLSKTPIIKDQRRNKSQGYILQDERKPPPVSTALLSAPSSTLPYLSSNCDPYQYPSMRHQQHPAAPSQDFSSFGRHSYGLSDNNQTIPCGQRKQPIYGGEHRTYPPFQPVPPQHNQSLDLSNNDGMGLIYGRMGSTLETPTSSFYDYYNRNNMITPLQQNNNISYAPWCQYDQQLTPTLQSNPAHQIPTSAVPPPPPAFRMMNGPRPSKSVSFAPLSDHIVV